jgi:hypothetical protein
MVSRWYVKSFPFNVRAWILLPSFSVLSFRKAEGSHLLDLERWSPPLPIMIPA